MGFYGMAYGLCYPRVKGFRQDEVFMELPFGDKPCNGCGSSQLHFLCDL